MVLTPYAVWMLRLTFLVVVVLGLALAATAGGWAAPEPPNVLVILADDLGVEHLDWHPAGRTGGDPAPTPFLSSMAESALVFDQAYATPICSPSRACLLTGRYPFRSGMEDNAEDKEGGLKLSEVTVAEQLRRVGYATGMFGKWHVSPGPYDPVLQGFDHFDGTVGNLPRGGYYLWPRTVDVVSFWEQGYATTVVTDSALDWIAEQESSANPWFALVAYHAPHWPYDPPPPHLNPVMKVGPESDDKFANFRAMIEALDLEVERLVAGLGDDTLVIFAGDNGSHIPTARHPVLRNRAKFTPYQGGILVPAMAWGATVPRRGRTDGRVHLIDFYRTILDAAGAPCDDRPIDSLSLLAPGEEPWVSRRRVLFTERDGAVEGLRRAILGPRYKLVQFSERTELYDLEVDPWEKNDLLLAPLEPGPRAAFEALQRDLAAVLESPR